MNKKNLAVFYGGKSSEHDISIITGIQAALSADSMRYNIIPVYIGRNGRWFTGKNILDISMYTNTDRMKLKEVFLKPNSNALYIGRGKPYVRLDAALVCCHGLNGEDGTLQGVLELSNIPYTSGGVLACSAGMDKIVMKMIFKSAGLKILPFTYVEKCEFDRDLYGVVRRIKGSLKYPLIVKPANLGSSIGINIAENAEQLIAAINIAMKFDHRVIVENALTDFMEVNCSVLGHNDEISASVVEQPLSWKEFLTFDEKYMGGGKGKGMEGLKRKLPADIEPKMEEKVKKAAVQAFKAINCKGVARVDFMIDKEGVLYVNEINVIPGSLSYYLWEHEGISFEKLIDKLVMYAMQDWANKNSYEYAYKSSVLSGKKGKV